MSVAAGVTIHERATEAGAEEHRTFLYLCDRAGSAPGDGEEVSGIRSYCARHKEIRVSPIYGFGSDVPKFTGFQSGVSLALFFSRGKTHSILAIPLLRAYKDWFRSAYQQEGNEIYATLRDVERGVSSALFTLERNFAVADRIPSHYRRRVEVGLCGEERNTRDWVRGRVELACGVCGAPVPAGALDVFLERPTGNYRVR